MMLVSILLQISFTAEPVRAVAQSGPVYIIPVDQEIESGLYKFMKRGFDEATRMNAALIVLEINTPGGRVDSAEQIGELIRSSKVPTIAFVKGRAASAGSYIALNADKIAMQPGSTIGAAAIVDRSGQPIDDPKLVAYWKSEMAAAAELSGRNPAIAEGMTDTNIEVKMPEIGKTKQKGQIISLTADEAVKVGYAEMIAKTAEEVASQSGYSTQDMFRIDRTAAENISIFLTNPIVSTLLLFVGITGIIIELIVPGFGIPGILGIIAFVLYFTGNYIAGFAGSETWILFIIGLVMLISELFVPSFGILGIIGSVSLVTGVVSAAYDTTNAFISLSIAFAAAIIVVIIVSYIFKERGIWNRFILRYQLTKEEGYIPNEPKDNLIGKQGTSLTPLRPAGTAIVDGKRIDVVTEGGFIEAGRPVMIISVDGTRVVVKEG
nr:nodulation protein NfeD [Paenibacillus sediminis]